MNYDSPQMALGTVAGGYANAAKEQCAMEYETRTVESNIDLKIAACKAEIVRLEQSKIDLAPLLKMRIRDIQQAMQF